MGTGTNTPCLQLRDDASGASLILDAGTGLVGYGERATAEPAAHAILLSHYHWDHVQGLPFFSPCFRPGSQISVVGPALGSAGAEWLSTLFGTPHFPVSLHSLPSPPQASFVEPGAFHLGGFHVRALRLNHPGGAFAYRITGASGDLVYATDHEFGDPEVDEALARFVSHAAALVIDAHYTPEELPRARGRGHGSWVQGVALAAASAVGHVWLFHHKPGRTDDEIAAMEHAARLVLPGTSAAREGREFTV
jgi:phosphoribosyl 1,2-cyclic phosphodiesterase